MSQHVPEDLLVAFVDGEVGEQLAVHIAQHLDSCPACATRAATLEPLAPVFAAVQDPTPPPGLAESVLAALQEPIRVPTAEVVLSVGFLVAAVLFTVLGGDPLGGVVRLGVFADVVATLGSKMSVVVMSSALAVTMSTLLALSTILVTARLALPARRSS